MCEVIVHRPCLAWVRYAIRADQALWYGFRSERLIAENVISVLMLVWSTFRHYWNHELNGQYFRQALSTLRLLAKEP